MHPNQVSDHEQVMAREIRQSMRPAYWFLGVFIAVTSLVAFAAITSFSVQYSAASSDTAIRAAEGLGYTNVLIIEKQPTHGLAHAVGCGIGDIAKFIATARNMDGITVPMHICVTGERATVYF